jgi:V8-like Glu-specific endopeptidase
VATNKIGARLSLERLEERCLPAGWVTNPIPTPNPAIVRIEVRWDLDHDGVYTPGHMTALGWKGDFALGGSGAMVGPHDVLTAAHVVHPSTIPFVGPPLGPPSDNPTWIVVFPGARGSVRPFGQALAISRYVEPSYLAGDHVGNDIALLGLDRNLGDYTGYFTYGWARDSILPSEVQVMGYPSVDNGAQRSRRGPLLHPAGLDNPKQFFFSNDLSDHGGSGSPVIDTDPNWVYPTILGVYDNKAIYADATRITADKFDWLWGNPYNQPNYDPNQHPGKAIQRKEPCPGDRADLFDSDTWFGLRESSLRVTPVQTRTGTAFNVVINARVWNGGTASAGSFTVRFFAENVTTKRRYTLDERTVAGLLPFQGLTSTSASVRLNLPAGDYKFGWLIDARNSVRELKEVHNAGWGENVGYVVGQTVRLPAGQILTSNAATGGPAASLLLTASAGRQAAPAAESRSAFLAASLLAVVNEPEKTSENALNSPATVTTQRGHDGRVGALDAVFTAETFVPISGVSFLTWTPA